MPKSSADWFREAAKRNAAVEKDTLSIWACKDDGLIKKYAKALDKSPSPNGPCGRQSFLEEVSLSESELGFCFSGA